MPDFRVVVRFANILPTGSINISSHGLKFFILIQVHFIFVGLNFLFDDEMEMDAMSFFSRNPHKISCQQNCRELVMNYLNLKVSPISKHGKVNTQPHVRFLPWDLASSSKLASCVPTVF